MLNFLDWSRFLGLPKLKRREKQKILRSLRVLNWKPLQIFRGYIVIKFYITKTSNFVIVKIIYFRTLSKAVYCEKKIGILFKITLSACKNI